MPTPKKTRRGEPWTLSEIKQLGQNPDSVLARRFRRTIREVVSERERRRIQLPTVRHDWTMREIRLLGRFNDHETARRLNRSYDAVRLLRINLGIPALRPLPKGRVWTRAEDRLLGTMSDKQLARRLRRTWVAVEARRILFKIPKCDAKAHQWTPEEDAMLGVMSDSELAARMGVSRQAVANRRRRLSIPVRYAHRRPWRREEENCWGPGQILKSRRGWAAQCPRCASSGKSWGFRIYIGFGAAGGRADSQKDRTNHCAHMNRERSTSSTCLRRI